MKSKLLLLLMLVFLLLQHFMASAQKQKVIVATLLTNYKEGIEEVAANYEALNPDVEIEMIFIKLNYETWIRTQFTAGNTLAPDIYNGNVTNSYGRQGKWVALNEYLNQVNPYTAQPWYETLEMNLVEKGKEAGSYYPCPWILLRLGFLQQNPIQKIWV